MAKFLLTALTAAEAAGRPAFHTGIAMVGRGPHEYTCAHCGRIMISDFDIATVPATMVFVCGNCDGLNGPPLDPPSA